MKPIDIYLEFGVDQYNVRSREAEDIVTRFAIRKILRERGLTLREIGRIEGSIDGGAPVHHSSIITSLKSTDRRILGEVLVVREYLEKWERAQQEAKIVDIKKALRESGAIPASGVHSQSLDEFAEVLARNAPAITYVEKTETASERAIRERRQHKEALDRLKMRIDEKHSEAQRVIDKISEDVVATTVAQRKSLLSRIIKFFTGD